ncbi:right-handed parallel beta-helix repeat-containing protein [Herbiconiux sp. VKM Ac-2851]|uniref:right-handed parallel beta-helix repeat-containing protein n=1 Tax=Herbiconiux sp. VKM Ac-2851 TaxID=2739025 RepID=UPI0015653457|nr:right-handed parallel beta-helix repeat-containing protein [Herbiconiux sp. VKM Ac-2851]NQX36238.1 fibronectin type III domain-containing protein [Herbiconiux sp. VKM Ac-2851]
MATQKTLAQLATTASIGVALSDALADPDSAASQTLAQAIKGSFAPATRVRSITEFLNPGETLDVTGQASIHAVFQRAINALSALYVADASSAFGQRGYEIEFPAGHFRQTQEAQAKTGVGVRGQGPTQTVFHPEGTQRFMAGGADTVDINLVFADNNFTSFTVDSAKVQKSGATYDGSIKGIFIRNMLRPRFDTVHIVNTWATAFGLDYLRDGDFVDCFAKNTGRGHRANAIGKPTDDERVGSGAGFGLGTGLYQDEPVRFTNCAAEDCYTSAFFTETVASVGATYRSRGHQFIGCSGKGSQYGFLDAGSDGAIVAGCNFSYNLLCGVGLDGTHAAPGAGVNGKVTDTVIAYNGEGNSSAAGVLITRALFGRYRIDGCTITGNFGPGIKFAKDDTDTYGADACIAIVGNEITFNQGAAIRAARLMPPRTAIDRNTTYGNTAALEIVNGTSSYTHEGLRLRFNDFAETSTVTQTLSNPVVTNNIGINATIPQAVAAAADATVNGKVTLTWTAPLETPTDYRVEWQNTNTGTWNTVSRTASTSTSQTITGLPSFAKLAFRVAGIVSGAVGTYSSLVYTKLIPAPYAADYFNRADGVLTTAPDGQNTLTWNDRDAGAWSILSLSARPTVTYTNSVRKALTLDTGSADGAVRARYFKAPPVATDVSTSGLLVRYVDSSNYVVLDMTSAGVWQLRKRVAGTYSTIQGAIATAAVGDLVMVQFSGNVYTVTINENPSVTATDAGSSLITATSRGLMQAGANVSGGGSPMKWDDFETWNVAA